MFENAQRLFNAAGRRVKLLATGQPVVALPTNVPAVPGPNTGVVMPTSTPPITPPTEVVYEAEVTAGPSFRTTAGIFNLEAWMSANANAIISVANGTGEPFRVTDIQGPMIPPGISVFDLLTAARVQCGYNIPTNWLTGGVLTGAAVAAGNTSSIIPPVGTNGRVPLMLTGLAFVSTSGGAGTANVNVTARSLEGGPNAAAVSVMQLSLANDVGMLGGYQAEILCLLNLLDNTSWQRIVADNILSRSYDSGAEAIGIDAAYGAGGLANTTLRQFAPFKTNPALLAMALIATGMEALNSSGSQPRLAQAAQRFLSSPEVAEFVRRLAGGISLHPLHMLVVSKGEAAGLTIGRRSVY